MKATGSHLAALLATALGLAMAAGSAECQTFLEEGPPVAAAEVSEVAGGIVVYIDPVTGAILEAPAPGSIGLPLTSALLQELSTSSAGLDQVPIPGGGVIVDLRGRFQSPLIATIDAQGAIRTQHLEELPGGDPH